MAQTAIASLRKILNAFRALNSKGIDPMNGTQTDLLARILKEVQGLSLGGAIADGSVTTAKIADGNVTTIKIADSNITTAKIADANVTPAKLSQPYTRSAPLTLSGVSSDFTGIPSWANIIVIAFNGISTNGANNYLIQLGSGSVDAASYSAFSQRIGASSSLETTFTTGFGINAAGATYAVSGTAVLVHMGSNLWICSGVVSAVGIPVGFTFSGSKTLSGALDRIRLTAVGGTDTWDAGTANIQFFG